MIGVNTTYEYLLTEAWKIKLTKTPLTLAQQADAIDKQVKTKGFWKVKPLEWENPAGKKVQASEWEGGYLRYNVPHRDSSWQIAKLLKHDTLK